MRTSARIAIGMLDNIIWVMLFIIAIIATFIMPYFFSIENLINLLYAAVGIGMIVMAQGICLISGHFDLSIESTAGFAPMIAVLFMMKWIPGLNPVIAILVLLTTGALVGLFNGYFVAVLKINAFLQTLAMLIILRGFMLFLIPISVYGFPRIFEYPGGGLIAGKFPVAIIILFVMYFIIDFILKRTPFGRHFYAVGGNLQASFISGINTKFTIIMAFVLSGVLASIGGFLLVGRMDAVTNRVGEGLVMLSFAGAVLGGVSLNGGRGRVSGMLGGVLLLTIIDNVLTLKGLNPYLIYATKGIILLIAIVTDQLKENLRQKILMNEELYKYSILNKIV